MGYSFIHPAQTASATICDILHKTTSGGSANSRHFEEYSANLNGFDGAKEWFNMTPFEACDLLTAFLGAPVK